MSAPKKTRINEQIRVPEVRLIDAEGEQVGVVSTADALERASQASLDLVEVSPNAKPPVCKIMDFGKYKFQLSKKSTAAKKKQKQIHLKEIKFRPGTEQADFDFKFKKIINFLSKGNKVKATVRFRGREMAHQELGQELLQRLQAAIEENENEVVIEQKPKMEGRQMIMVLAPGKSA